MKKECSLYKKIKDNLIQCTCCSHYCVIKNNEIWKCWIRQNLWGKLFLLTYWQVFWLHTDPIEKKPLFHFLPWSKIFSFWTAWCNFTCDFCQNYNMSQLRKNNSPHIETLWISLSPQKAVDYCIQNHIPSIAFTYNEPTIFFEYAYDVMNLAKVYWIKTVFVSNWFQSKEFWEASKWLIDAINIDLKWFNESFYKNICGAKLNIVLKNIEYIYYNTSIFLEITTLIIPWENDSDEELRKIAKFLKWISPSIPWHISAFYPAYKMLNYKSTSLETLLKAYNIWKEEWLKYIYIWNISDLDYQITYCPKCWIELIERDWFIWNNILNHFIEQWICFSCNEKIPWIWM